MRNVRESYGEPLPQNIRRIKSAGAGGIMRRAENHGRRWLGRGFILSPDTDQLGEIYIGFWDANNNDNLFIKTEDEFKWEFPDGIHLGRPKGVVTEEPESPFISLFFSE